MSDSPNTNHLLPGSMIQEYKIDKVLGSGNFGIVYQASNIKHLPGRNRCNQRAPTY